MNIGYRRNFQMCSLKAIVLFATLFSIGEHNVRAQPLPSPALCGVAPLAGDIIYENDTLTSQAPFHDYNIFNDIINRKKMPPKKALEKIVHGRLAESYLLPWMVYLVNRNEAPGNRTFFCGGTMIGYNIILTAEHCVYQRSKDDLVVIVPDPGLQQSSNVQKFAIRNIYNAYAGCDNTIKRGDPATNCHRGDIAFLRLTTSIKSTPFTSICLPANKNELYLGKAVLVAGWGRFNATIPMAPNPPLQYTSLMTMSNSECQFRLQDHPAVEAGITTDVICARAYVNDSAPKRDPCMGDSGGPLMYRDPHSLQYYVIGVVSVGDCGIHPVGYPSIYTRVTPFVDWIQNTV